MLEKANKNKDKSKMSNVQFIKSSITNLALPDGIADCVINLVPEADKHIVFREALRLLKSGGRVAMSDILVKKELPDYIKQDWVLYVGCIAGASRLQQYHDWLRQAGFIGEYRP